MEFKEFTPEFKTGDSGLGIFSGYASTWDNWDAVNERPARGAFAKSLPAFAADGFIALGHSWDSLPIATVKEAFEDDHGLFLSAEFHGTAAAQDARKVLTERLARGKSAKLSIGYEVLKDSFVNDPPGGRLLEEIKLHEVSIVNVPANDRASILSAKGVVPDAMPLADYSDAVLAAVKEFDRRVSSLKEMRAKQGRVLSETNRKRIGSLLEALTAVADDLNTLLSETEPKANPDAAKALFLEFQRIQATINGALST